MKKYQSYKDSEVEWIGEIPRHWEFKKISWCFETIGSGTTPKSNNEIFYENGNVNWLLTGDLNDGDITFTSRKITNQAIEAHSTLKTYPKGSIVMAMYGATIGKLGILKIATTTNQACCVLSKSKVVVEKYVFYWLLSSRKDIINLSYGGGQPNISQDIVRNLRITCPPLPEQQQIVSFLDRKTQLIDNLIQHKEKKIELLKEKRTSLINHVVTKGLDPNVEMKDSGVEWIGEIPSHWKKKKLGYCVNLQGRIGFKGYKKTDFVEEGEGCRVIGGKHIDNSNKLNLSNPDFLHWDKYYESPEIMVKKGDLIISQRGTLGKVLYIDEDYGEMTINPSLVLVNKIKENPVFLWYYLQSDTILKIIDIEGSVTTIPMLSQEEISNFPVILPPSEEQQNIVEHLNTHTKEIDELIELEKNKTHLLKEYRQSIISEVVTGKIRVCEEDLSVELKNEMA
ncbi:restriction endonuclease subunit S [Algoriphagus aestuarii]|nr:restriction endonuclease subunit S [Algoriphagus aestuarii]